MQTIEVSRATCTCGWTGPSRETQAEANTDADAHRASDHCGAVRTPGAVGVAKLTGRLAVPEEPTGGVAKSPLLRVMERAKKRGWPASTISTLNIEAGETGWLLSSQRLTPAGVDELGRMFDSIEERETQDRHEEWREAERRKGPDPELARQAEEEARADFERYERERPRRIEDLLSRIANALAPKSGI